MNINMKFLRMDSMNINVKGRAATHLYEPTPASPASFTNITLRFQTYRSSLYESLCSTLCASTAKLLLKLPFGVS